MQLTAEGFQRKTYDDYLSEMAQQAMDLFGADVNLSENGPMGKWIKMLAFARAEESELAEAVYLSASVDNAEGISLDYAVKNVGLSRLQATKATVSINLTVDAGTTIDPGLIVATVGNLEFISNDTLTDSDNDGLITAMFEALEAGNTGNVPPNTITVINTPAAGLQAVNNPTEATGGRDKESDKELRDRQTEIGAASLSSTVNGIRAAILNDVPGVKSVIVINNNKNTTDADGRPPNSYEAIVYGGNADDIATTILKAGPAGIQPYGAQTITVKDDSGNDQTIGFSYATQVPVIAHVECSTDATFPANGVALITTEIIKYIGGEDADGKQYAGLGMGQSLVGFKLASNIINNVPGVTDIANIQFERDSGTMSGMNLYIASKEVAHISISDVDVIV